MRPVDEFVPAIVERFGLGRSVAPPVELHGGSNRVWRVATDQGEFAIHELIGFAEGADPIGRCQQILELELRAAETGVPLARPIREPGTGLAAVRVDPLRGCATVHEWVEGRPLRGTAPSAGMVSDLGAALGRLHGLRLDPGQYGDDLLNCALTVGDWEGLAAAARQGGWGWAEELHRAAGDLVAAAELLDSWDAPGGTPLLTHRDLTPDNVLEVAGSPVLIDWESAGPAPRGSDLGRTALDNVARSDRLDPVLLREFLAGYALFDELPPVGLDWCSLWVRALVAFVELCARSCIERRGPGSLLEFQSQVVGIGPGEIAKRIGMAGELVDAFGAAAEEIG